MQVVKFKSNLKQPKDKNIHLQNIIEGDTTQKAGNFWLSQLKKFYFEDNLLMIEFQQKHTEGTSSLRRIISAVRAFDEKANCLTATMHKSIASNGVTNILQQWECRMVTPLECERLQTLPDNYTYGISKTRRYQVLGNAWNVNTVVHILRGLYDKI